MLVTHVCFLCENFIHLALTDHVVVKDKGSFTVTKLNILSIPSLKILYTRGHLKIGYSINTEVLGSLPL